MVNIKVMERLKKFIECFLLFDSLPINSILLNFNNLYKKFSQVLMTQKSLLDHTVTLGNIKLNTYTLIINAK